MKPALDILRKAARVPVDFALPARCPACGCVIAEDHRFCLDCWQQLHHLDRGCAQCGDPGIALLSGEEMCGACLADPPPFETMRAAVAYGDIARTLALRLKYGGRIGLAKTIAQAMRRHMAGLEDALLVPVPLHRGRIWRRGFNQAALIARALARGNPDRVRLDWLERTRATPFLKGMNRDRRARTVRGAFAVPKAKRAALKGRRIILIDDVYTSGSTTRACAKLLKRHGASEVHVRCWARVARRDPDDY